MCDFWSYEATSAVIESTLPKAHARVSADYMLEYEVHRSEHFSCRTQMSSTAGDKYNKITKNTCMQESTHV